MVRFLISLAIVTAVIIGAFLWALEILWIRALPSWWVHIMAYQLLTTGLIFMYLNGKASGDARAFVVFYLASVVMKILAGGAFVILMILGDRPGAYANVILFLIAYFSFTVVEVVHLFRRVQGDSYK